MKKQKSPASDDSLVDSARGILANLTRQLEKARARLNGNTAEVARAVGRLLELANLPQLAAEKYSHWVQLDPSSLEARSSLIVTLLKAGLYDDALEEATKLASQDPHFEVDTLIPDELVTSLALLGDVLTLQNKLDPAEQAYRAVLKTRPKDNYASGRLCQLLLRKLTVDGNTPSDRGALTEAITLVRNTQQNPRFRDIRAVLNLADSTPGLVRGVSLRASIAAYVAGRPFMVAGEHRRAEIDSSGWWLTRLSPGLTRLNNSQKAQLGEYWANMGREEHASVGSFSRFILQLLAVGAPVGLVQEANRSLNDETEHAELCFGIAAAALGHDVGVGPINIDTCLQESSDPWSILQATIVEGCVGETISAALAAESHRRCKDACISNVLERIAGDEARHADLAWEFTEWMLEAYPALALNLPDLISQATSDFAEEANGQLDNSTDIVLEEFGVLSEETALQQARFAFQNDVIPRLSKLVEKVHKATGEHFFVM